ncbi:MAG: serine/threonine-protein phosphatase [Anaerolineales bacterium]|nr:serine/threonine-protein phosphatase [Anaerolineales bacterium]
MPHMPVDAKAEVPEGQNGGKETSSSLETAALEPRTDADNTLLALGQIARANAGEQQLRVAKRCGVGAVRDRNEDACLVFVSETGGHFPLLPFGLYIVADGMGGHKNGHIASKIASRTAARHIIEKIYLPLLQMDGLPGATPIQEVLENAVEQAHAALFDPEEETDSGTTLTIALVLGRRLYAAHVGDTRIYLLTGDKLETVTIDHSLVQRLQDVGQLTAEEAISYEYRHVLLRAVGQGEDVAVDTYTRLLPKRGRLLLCSDGLHGFVPDYEISMLLQQDKPVQELAANLHDAAMDAGGYDNITAIVVDFNL